MSSKRPNAFLSPIVHEIDALSPEQKRQGRQICFWALLAYLEFDWFRPTSFWLLIPAAAIGGAAFFLTKRPTFIALHGALLVAMIPSAVRSVSWPLLIDFAALSTLVVFELMHRRHVLLVAIAFEHALALKFDPWSAITSFGDAAQPLVSAAVLFRVFAIFMLVALWFRMVIVPRVAPPPPPEPEPPPQTRPLTVAEWEARNKT